MSTEVIRIPTETAEMLRKVKAKTGQTIGHLVKQAVEKAYGNGAVIGATVDKKG